MLIVADENIPAVHDAFSDFGEVITLPGRQISARDVHDADILLVRSVTRVDESLLAGSKIQFVGSATIGTDHVDEKWLDANGIVFANAPGSNAISAAEYVLSALMTLHESGRIELRGKTAGIIGCGNVGSRVKVRLEALGVDCIVCDPPLAEVSSSSDFVSMAEITRADIVTAHVPLVSTGKYPTVKFIDRSFLSQLKPASVFINTARGQVVDESALKAHLKQNQESIAVLDVWMNEPDIDMELMQHAAIATPHIAGYGIDGKIRATVMLHDALCRFFNRKSQWNEDKYLPVPEEQNIMLDSDDDPLQAVHKSLLHVYDVRNDDRRLRDIIQLPANKRAAEFDRLRKTYPIRRECSAYNVILENGSTETISVLNAFGFDYSKSQQGLAQVLV
ncbi:MAG: 4-phosphoerythronate dehydrogenase [Gammaproteobacteria bacterium]|nr:MAG: 4-phosphoerythronate dehydrogenase [Gammaproteobacteria bacterium]